jgi:hypothetical protein
MSQKGNSSLRLPASGIEGDRCLYKGFESTLVDLLALTSIDSAPSVAFSKVA